MSLTSKHWAVRTVRNNRVTICGRVFVCPTKVDPGDRFEGLRMMFGRYPQVDGYLFFPFVHCWGTEEEARMNREELRENWPGVVCHEDGYFYWESWREEGEEE